MLQLEPTVVWKFFYAITQIPRPSKHEEQIMEWIKGFAKSRNLVWKADEIGNVVVCKPASAGMENKPAVILQAHTDMVCEKNRDKQFDFATESIQAYVDGDWVKAQGTTLGGDNGIGMAMMLAILDSNELSHPALECLFTVDEETGLSGAFALKPNFLEGSILINLDSEDDGEIFVGCAGGIDTVAELSYKKESVPERYFGFRVEVKGLLGGHSGDDINKNRGNANKILNRFLWVLNREMDLRIQSFDGGNLRNAIAREATALCAVPWSEKETIRVLFNHYVADLELEILDVEPSVRLELGSEVLADGFMDKRSSDKLLDALYACPHGVVSMSRDMDNLVETSTNLASVKMVGDDKIVITTSQRSSVESSRNDIAQQVEAVFCLADAVVTHGDGYPGWKPNLKSQILTVAQKAYGTLMGEEPKIRAIHAGLECGLFLEKYPYLDMISIGPQMYGVHSPDERLSISSTQKCWAWLLEILSTI